MRLVSIFWTILFKLKKDVNFEGPCQSQRWFVLGSLIQNIINSCLICLIKTRSSYSIFMWALNEINIPHSCQMSEDNRRHPLMWRLLYNLALFGWFFFNSELIMIWNYLIIIHVKIIKHIIYYFIYLSLWEFISLWNLSA